MWRLTATGIVLALLAPATAATASREVLESHAALGVPALASDRVVVSAFPAPGAIDLLSAPFAGDASRLLSWRGHPRDPASITYGAAGSRVVAARGLAEGGTRDVLSGPPAGPLAIRESCETVSAVSPAGGGSVIAWGGAGCVPDRLRIEWDGGAADIDPPGFVTALAAGGRFAAWLALDRATDPVRTRLFVYDTAARAIVRDEPVPPSSDLDVQEDGTALIDTFAPGPADGCPPSAPAPRFVLFPAGAPARDVPLRSCSSRVRIAGGRIAFVQRTASGGEVISLAGLAGEDVQAITGQESFPPMPRFDWDGERVAWATTRCRDHALFVRDPADGGPAPDGGHCRIRIGSPRLGRDGSLHVRVACREGCIGGPGLTVISPRWLHFRSRGRPMPYRGFDLRPERATTLRLPLTARQRALIRRRGRVEVRLKALGLNLYEPRVARTLRAR
ncbi:MAG TPA: hypothetical protein VNT32_06025 [Thermoleophilaceae bacterium]|nr:hypothetical protein [Thermoleophilaceae bacterium]